MNLAIAVAAAVGVVIAWQAAAIGEASRTVNPLLISLALLLSGLIFAVVWVTLVGGWPDVSKLMRQRWWLPLGLAGWLLVGAIGAAAARLGVAAALSIIISAQLITGVLLEVSRGTRNFTARSAVAIVLMAASVWLLHPPEA